MPLGEKGATVQLLGVTSPVPRRSLGVSAIIRDHAGAVLLVEHRHDDAWQLPGGVDEDVRQLPCGVAIVAELPHVALGRKIRMTTGLHVSAGPLLVVDYAQAEPGVTPGRIDFVYDGGAAGRTEDLLISAELTNYTWALVNDFGTLIRPPMECRIRQALGALATGATACLVEGQPVHSGQG